MPLRILIAAAVFAASASASVALAQAEQPAPPSAATQPITTPSSGAGDALARDPEVVESQGPMPDETGTRAPQAQATETETPTLSQALDAIYSAPPDLQGNPVQRPNPLGSKPVADTQ
ncbi:hypothetical protein ACM64Y_09800 [Novispirillum sp. DQ9]|uniref:hypothetical protein n=1 Tax=Novispirillum sp. DQ9 TaxID=3398612 RepID=UPI003C7C719D